MEKALRAGDVSTITYGQSQVLRDVSLCSHPFCELHPFIPTYKISLPELSASPLSLQVGKT